MRIKRETVLIANDNFTNSSAIIHLKNDINNAIEKAVWPQGNDRFSINPTYKGNGVKPIKQECMAHLYSKGWFLEQRLKISSESNAGPIDAVYPITDHLYFAVEWETGNISSSHRALNKICLGILNGSLLGGTLILPSREMYPFLTDRIGNYQELSPYFNVWRNFNIANGYLSVIEVEHDEIDVNAPLIPKGTDGRAKF
ncbi:restriction endonuclease [Salmonella enterica]|uniref:Restriction endonuclease n=7 Tax=Salmonella enterica TaxID=28901 RepID=A0A2I5HPE7_SALDZ|nr:restriction endonuclease [Salmonella enterica]EBP3743823.1 restriction endonuclease [Salmonella enterica subsp. arizonae]ECG1721493.1 restriction endonuclease [Salmonella enterica subsp. diarizonae serovar 17:z10:e,n,x,z15]ECS6772190.1 restriction endonuclease [Salmonella enterica subsp. diarizonae serovar 65:z10:e,n,x,z15]EDN2302410.1 restriction endonuclease [Salmonella enterica subsp. diarizonae serovar 65:(k):z]EDQ4423741.1 restriction endonuclease [Salmonella enterica subsp. salamae]E